MDQTTHNPDGPELARLRIRNDSLVGALYGDLVQIGNWLTLARAGNADLLTEAMERRRDQLRGFLGGPVPAGAMTAAEQPAAPVAEPESPAERGPEPPPPPLKRPAAKRPPTAEESQAEAERRRLAEYRAHEAAIEAERSAPPAAPVHETRPRSHGEAAPVNPMRLPASEPVPTRQIRSPEQFAALMDARGVGAKKPAATAEQESRKVLRQEW